MSVSFDWEAAAKEVRDLCESSGWEVNQTQAELAVAALCDRFMSDAERAVIAAVKAWRRDREPLPWTTPDSRLRIAVDSMLTQQSSLPDAPVAAGGEVEARRPPGVAISDTGHPPAVSDGAPAAAGAPPSQSETQQ